MSLRSLVISLAFVLTTQAQHAYTDEIIDLAKTPADIQILTGGMQNGLSVENIAAGDINGDGYDDLIVRGLANQGAGRHGGSVIAIIFGKRLIPNVINLSEMAPDIRISLIGTRAAPYQDPAAFVGDINGDQIGDLIIPTEEGLAVLFGRTQWPSQIDLNTHPPDLRVIVRTAIERGKMWRGLVATGDINKDGIDELVFSHASAPIRSSRGAELSRDLATRRGIVGWMFWGRKAWPHLIDVTTQRSDTVISGPQGNQDLGNLYRAKIADFDGDGFGDIVMGSWDGGENNGIGGTQEDPWTKAWIIPGASSLSANIELGSETSAINSRPTGITQKQPAHIDFHSQGYFVEGGLFVADIAGDDKPDIVVSVIKELLPSYVAHRDFCLVPGSSHLFEHPILDTRKHCMMIHGETIQRVGPMRVPQPVVGNFNGDDKTDLFVLSLSSQEFIGIWGRRDFRSVVDVDVSADVKILPPLLAGEKGSTPVGYGITYAMADVNGDKRADLLVVAPLDRGGAVHIVLGKEFLGKTKE